jgi:hypothetical protein
MCWRSHRNAGLSCRCLFLYPLHVLISSLTRGLFHRLELTLEFRAQPVSKTTVFEMYFGSPRYPGGGLCQNRLSVKKSGAS